jgi:radical SAM protein with 4Fe4S-binding SPASM domain
VRLPGSQHAEGQAENRLEFLKRFGFAAFGGAGEVVNKVSEFRSDQIKPGGSMGLKFRLTKANHIDVRGYVAQCDCWVTSYPEYRFGNIYGPLSFTELLKRSKARQRFQMRPEVLIEHETSLDCDYLSICHGGCPVRTFSITGDFFVKDPYCKVYKALFSTMEEMAVVIAAIRSRRALPILHAVL